MKLHLTARVPNEGARRLAQWVLGLPGGVPAAAKALEVSEEWVQRMVAGDLIPGLLICRRLYRFTGLTFRDFQLGPRAGWFERPAQARRMTMFGITHGRPPWAVRAGKAGPCKPPAYPALPGQRS